MEGTGEFGERMNSMPKYVVTTTRTPDQADWNNSHVIGDNVAEEVAKLKQQPGKDILLAGSDQLLRTLMEHHLVDELRLMLHPIVLGSGKRLFNEGIAMSVLELVDTKRFSSGIVVLTYRPVEERANA